MQADLLESSLAAVDSAPECNACHCATPRSLGLKHGYELFQCQRCGVISAGRVLGQAALIGDLYDHYYDRAGFETEEGPAASLEKLARSFEPFRRSGRWLDVGYGEGGLLSIADRHGWSCYGVEVSPQCLEYGRRRGWIVSSNAEDLKLPEQGFDIVTMIEFLEHARDPRRFLSDSLRWLRPGGLLYLTTPNANSLNRLYLGLEWSIFSPPEHITIWTRRGLRSALGEAGFQCRRIRTEGFNPCEILARLRGSGRGDDAVPVDRNQAALALSQALSGSPLRRGLKRAANGCLSFFGVGDTLKVWAVKAERES